MCIRETYKRADSWRNQHRSGVIQTTLVAQPVYTKIGRVRAGLSARCMCAALVGVVQAQRELF